MSTDRRSTSLNLVTTPKSISKRTTLRKVMGISAALLFAGCSSVSDSNTAPEQPIAGDQQAVTAIFNGNMFNGNMFNGNMFNGNMFNGNMFNGNMFNGNMFNGNMFNGLGFDGTSWDGGIWGGGTGPAQDCTVTGSDPTCTSMHDYINHVNANGSISATPISASQRMANIIGVQEWVECACPAGFSVSFSDNHGLGNMTFYGALGLAKYWCSPTKAVQATEAEKISDIQIVSACLLARVNTKGKHYPLSMRSLERGTAVTTNEKFISYRYLATYGANLWKKAHADFDSTSPVDSTNLLTTGGEYWNMERFVITDPSFPYSSSNEMADQFAMGRDCEQSNCGGRVAFLGVGGWDRQRKALGEWGNWDPSNPSKGYYKPTDPNPSGLVPQFPTPPVPGYLQYNYAASQGGGTDRESFSYRGLTYRVMEIWGPEPIPLESPSSGYSHRGRAWAQVEDDGGNELKRATCTGGVYECDTNLLSTPQKLVNLKGGQRISINFSGNDPDSDDDFGNGSATEANTLAIRYSRPTKLGPGQCDVDTGCLNTRASDCASGVVGSLGCVGGSANPGLLQIFRWTSETQLGILRTTKWVPVHGNAAPYGKNIFPATGSTTKYQTAYVYPVYMEDSGWSIPGSPNSRPGINTIRMQISGEAGDGGDNSPELDGAYYFAGPPPADATCTGPNACWLFVGPNQQTGNLDQGEETTPYVSPFLPPGNYKFQITDVVNDANLYVLVSYPAPGQSPATVTTSNYTCKPSLGSGVSEVCNVVVNGRGGYISAMVKGKSSAKSSATLLGKN